MLAVSTESTDTLNRGVGILRSMDNPGILGVSRESMDTQNLALLDDLGMSGSISGHLWMTRDC